MLVSGKCELGVVGMKRVGNKPEGRGVFCVEVILELRAFRGTEPSRHLKTSVFRRGGLRGSRCSSI